MKEELIDLETAKLAKEVGFDWPCERIYCPSVFTGTMVFFDLKLDKDDITYKAPTLSLLQKWLREERKINIFVSLSGGSEVTWFYSIDDKTIGHSYNSYEEALLIGLKEALKTLKK